jgi:hypothetical protein
MHLRLTSILAILAACGPGSSMSETEPGSETAGPSTGDASADTGATTGAPTSGGPSSTGDTGDAVPCGAELPPAGSACASEGEACAPDADPCAPYTSAECRGGVWSYVEVGPGDPEQCAPDCDPFPVEGEACAQAGASCSSGCADQCEFCNILSCEAGTWQRVEVFPAPCLSCMEVCAFTIQPMCAAGPPDEAACVAGCEEGRAGECKIPFSNMLACIGGEPVFTCDAAERPEVAGCEAQFAELYACLGV